MKSGFAELMNESLSKLQKSVIDCYKPLLETSNLGSMLADELQNSMQSIIDSYKIQISAISDVMEKSINELCNSLITQVREILTAQFSFKIFSEASPILFDCLNSYYYENDTCFFDFDTYNSTIQIMAAEHIPIPAPLSDSADTCSDNGSSKKMSPLELILFVITILEFIMNIVTFYQSQQYTTTPAQEQIINCLSYICSFFEKYPLENIPEEPESSSPETQPLPSDAPDIPDIV